jgi:hypothetical protein
MRRKIGIGLLVILNLTFIYVIIMGSALTYRLIVVQLGKDKGLEIANSIANDIFVQLSVVSIIVLLINYFLTKKMIANEKPFLTSLAVTMIGVIVFIPFFLSERQSFLNYQSGSTKMQHYLYKQTIRRAQIITILDTIDVQHLDDFISDIGFAKYKRGSWKYAKKMKLVFERTDGKIDSIFTNGQVFGPYEGMYFSTDHNVIDKYLAE